MQNRIVGWKSPKERSLELHLSLWAFEFPSDVLSNPPCALHVCTLRPLNALEEAGQSRPEQNQRVQKSAPGAAQTWEDTSRESGCYTNYYSFEKTKGPHQVSFLANDQNDRLDPNTDA